MHKTGSRRSGIKYCFTCVCTENWWCSWSHVVCACIWQVRNFLASFVKPVIPFSTQWTCRVTGQSHTGTSFDNRRWWVSSQSWSLGSNCGWQYYTLNHNSSNCAIIWKISYKYETFSIIALQIYREILKKYRQRAITLLKNI